MIARLFLFPSLVLAAASVSAPVLHAQPADSATFSTPARLTVEEVVKLFQAGFSEDLIITRIKKNGKAFDLNTDEMLELKKLGVTDNVIKYLLDPAQPYTPPPPPAPPASPAPENTTGAAPQPQPPAAPAPPAKQYPADDYAAKVPPDPGLYRFSGETPESVDLKMLLGLKEGPGLGKLLMKKGKLLAYLVGPAAKARVQGSAPTFYMRLAPGKAMEEFVLVALEQKSGHRELEIGPPGPKPQLKAEDMRPFDAVEVGPQLFKITVKKLTKGEYMLFPLSSAEPPKGSYGKGFDFGVDPPAQLSKKRS